MASTTSPPISLPDLLPDSFMLVYAVPLLVASFIATFAGTFLTFDRTRSFPPIDPPSRKIFYRLGGGVGGIIAGLLCGMHLTTYLSLLIVNRTKMHLSGVEFLVIWLLSGGLLAVVGGGWQIASGVFYALIAGGSFTCLIDIIFLPKSLLPRLVIYVVFTIILMVGALLPIARTQHAFARTCSALAGSIGFIISIALFSKQPGWSSPWLTLAITPYVGNHDAKEKGLSFAICAFAVLGAATDWLLKLKIGEDPDKEWDSILAGFAGNLPYGSQRAGTFKPLESFWTRLIKGELFHRRGKDDILFPPDDQLLPKPVSSVSSPPMMEKSWTGTPPPSFRPYPPTRGKTLTKSNGRSAGFKSLSDLSDSSDDEKGSPKISTRGSPPKYRPWLPKRTSTTNSAQTLVDGKDSGLALPPKLGTTLEEYSDVEQDVASVTPVLEDRDSPGWKPAFLRKHEEEIRRSGSLKGKEKEVGSTSSKNSSGPAVRFVDSPLSMSRETTRHGDSGGLTAGTPEDKPTPSLIRALDRIEKAHRAGEINASPIALTTRALPPPPTTTEVAFPTPSEPSQRSATPPVTLDESFWHKVKSKAEELTHHPSYPSMPVPQR